MNDKPSPMDVREHTLDVRKPKFHTVSTQEAIRLASRKAEGAWGSVGLTFYDHSNGLKRVPRVTVSSVYTTEIEMSAWGRSWPEAGFAVEVVISDYTGDTVIRQCFFSKKDAEAWHKALKGIRLF
jgi:hypothetical protein